MKRFKIRSGLDYDDDYVHVASLANENKEIDLKNTPLLKYKFIVIVCGWGYYKTVSCMPIKIFKIKNKNFNQFYTNVKIYNATGWVSVNYISDTKIKVNGQIGTDTVTDVYLWR